MRKKVGQHERMGDERFYILEFDEETRRFNLIVEEISRKGETSSRSTPLEDAQGERGYHHAIAYIKEKLFPEGGND